MFSSEENKSLRIYATTAIVSLSILVAIIFLAARHCAARNLPKDDLLVESLLVSDNPSIDSLSLQTLDYLKSHSADSLMLSF